MTVPVPVPAESIADWSDRVDVLVVGFGIAGACAAVEAAEAGARVLVIDRAERGGSTTALAGGHFYLGGGTAVQRATGHPDSAEEMYKYLVAVSQNPDLAKIRLYCDRSVEHFDWLERQGLVFQRSYYPEKAVIQPGTEGLMHTGNEKVWPFRDLAVPAPRGHKVPVAGESGGAAMVIELLEARLAELGGQLRYATAGTELVVDGDRVVGAGWRDQDGSGHVHASAVILAAGGFVMNEEMLAEHLPALSGEARQLGTDGDDGLGIRLGLSVGGETIHMNGAFVSSPFYPPGELLHGIVVDHRGRRFVAEDSYHARTAAFVLDRVSADGAVGRAYLVLDSRTTGTPANPLAPLIGRWESIAEMEAGLGIEAGALQTTMADYDLAAARGDDPQLHKHADWVQPLDRGPWRAHDLTPGRATYLAFTLGGLRTSVDAQVLDVEGQTVPGLYAAGACASNIAQDGAGYSSGTCLGEGSFFGRLAGCHAKGFADSVR